MSQLLDRQFYPNAHLGSARFSIFAAFLLMAVAASSCCFGDSYPVEEHPGVVVILLRKGDHHSPVLPKWISGVPKVNYPDGATFADRYAWLSESLGRAFDLAEEGYGGNIGSITKRLPTRLILYQHNFPYLGTSWSRGPAGHIDIYMTSGMVDFVQGVASGLMMDAHRSKGDKTPDGIGYLDWMQGLRDGKHFIENGQPYWPGPRPPIEQKYVMQNIAVPCIVTYTFLFAHELGHFVLDTPSKPGDQALPTEMKIDLKAWKVLENRDMAFAPTVVAVEMALLYFQRIYAREIKMGLENLDAEELYAEMFRGADWAKRSTMIVNEWEKYLRSHPDSKLVQPGWENAVKELRGWIAAPLPPERSTKVDPTEDLGRTITTLLVAAGSRFESLKRESSIGPKSGKTFSTDMKVRGASRVELFYPESEYLSPSANIYFDLHGLSQADAATKYGYVSRQLKDSLQGWTSQESRSDEDGVERRTCRFRKGDGSSNVVVKFQWLQVDNTGELRVQVISPSLR